MKLVHPQDLLIEFTFSSRTWEDIFRDILVGIPNCHITNGLNDFPAERWLNKLVFRETGERTMHTRTTLLPFFFIPPPSQVLFVVATKQLAWRGLQQMYIKDHDKRRRVLVFLEPGTFGERKPFNKRHS
ncbi:hypothetical protein CDAR_582641 [Caerostris darwini]|uniref:Uncharacterized protein n=1 Tax=Caerostris darwini TaxID=1538125 RepID=A0AAV4PJN3_9ARAC|nr:hypothetical protein CDAR_582641 [Caerostris darwini]